MQYAFQPLAFLLFAVIVGVTLGISFWAARRVKTSSHYYVAGGGVKWLMNGIAFAGDYLSAASFLGIAGLIAFSGFDGFMYSIGFLAGWVVALLLVAEPLRRMGKYTFGDALVSVFQSKRVRLAAAVSTLVVSIFYLIPQIVGAGSIVQPLLGLQYEVGVVIVGALVILIVATAGMVSTTYVQFIKGFLLLLAALGLTIGVLIMAGKDPVGFISSILDSTVLLPSGATVSGDVFLSPGLKYKNPLDFASLAYGAHPRDGGPAPRPHQVLHRSDAGGRKKVDGHRHRRDRCLLCPHPLPRARRELFQDLRRDEPEPVRPAAGELHRWRAILRLHKQHSLRDHPRDRCGTHHGGCWCHRPRHLYGVPR